MKEIERETENERERDIQTENGTVRQKEIKNE